MRFNLRYFSLGMALVAATIGTTQALASSAQTTLEWDPPVYNADGSVLTDLEGYRVYYGTQSGIYSEFIDTENMTSTTVSLLEWDTDYVFAVKAYNHDDVESDFSEELALRTPELPSIVVQPQSTSTRALGSATFSVLARGTGPLDYTWRRDGEPLPLWHDTDYVVRVCTEQHDGAQYDVVVTSPYGSVTSHVAVLSVLPMTGWMSNGSYDWFEVDPDTSRVASYVDSGEETAAPSATGELTISFYSKSDRYVVWTRLLDNGFTGESGSFLVSMDGEPEALWYVSGGFVTTSSESRHWDVICKKTTRSVDINAKDAWVFQLSEGMHTLRIREYEPGSRIDLVLVTSDLSWSPENSLASDDGDGDGLPDTWEKLHFGSPNATVGSVDTDGDGVSNLDEFLAGSSAVDGLSVSLIGIYAADQHPRLIFEALEASGPGYDGLRRYYTLETCTDLRTGVWQPIPGYEAVLGQGQTIDFSVDSDNQTVNYRTSMWLE